MAGNMLTLMDVMPTAAERIAVTQAAQQQARQSEYEQAMVQQNALLQQQQLQDQQTGGAPPQVNALLQQQQLQDQQTGVAPPQVNALTGLPSNAQSPLQPGAVAPPAQSPLQPGAVAPPAQQRPQGGVPASYPQLLAQHQTQLYAQQQEQASVAAFNQTYGPVLEVAEKNHNSELLDKIAGIAKKSQSPALRQVGEMISNVDFDKQGNSTTDTRVEQPWFAEKLFNSDPEAFKSQGIQGPEDLIGKLVHTSTKPGEKGMPRVNVESPSIVNEDLAVKATTPALLRVKARAEALVKDGTYKSVAVAMPAAEELLHAEDEKTKVDEAERKETVKAEAEEKKYQERLKIEEQREEARRRDSEHRQDRADARFSKMLDLREYNTSAQPYKSAQAAAERNSNAAAGIEGRIHTNVKLAREWVNDYVKTHPAAQNRMGAVINDVVSGKIKGEGNYANIGMVFNSIGFELGKLEKGSFGSAGVTKDAAEHFNQLKLAKGADNALQQLDGIETLATTAKRAQDKVTEQARDEVNKIRTQYGLPVLAGYAPAREPTPRSAATGLPAAAKSAFIANALKNHYTRTEAEAYWKSKHGGK